MGTAAEPVAPRRMTVSAGIGLDAESLRQVRSQGGMARPGGEHEAKRPLAIDFDRRPDAADLVEARGRDVARFLRDDGDVLEDCGLEDYGLDEKRPLGRWHHVILDGARAGLGPGEQHQERQREHPHVSFDRRPGSGSSELLGDEPGTACRASSSLEGSFPPACAKSGRPPPRPPTSFATSPMSAPALTFFEVAGETDDDERDLVVGDLCAEHDDGLAELALVLVGRLAQRLGIRALDFRREHADSVDF